jgi:DNA mismatch repair protein MutS2
LITVNVSEHTAAVLGFEDIRRALASGCQTEMGKALALQRPFLEREADVEDSFAHISEARALLDEPLSLPFAGLLDTRGGVAEASKGAMLEPAKLIAICQCLFAFEHTSELLSARQERLPRLNDLSLRLPQLHALASRLSRSFEPSGEISDSASEALADARNRARKTHQRIRSRLDTMLRDDAFASKLQESYYSVRNDRYVVPVKASHQREVDGIVHNSSQTGQTLFIEPQAMVLLGNELAIVNAEVLEEERKVLVELSRAVAQHAERITEGVEVLSQLDQYESAGRLSNTLKAESPQLVSAGQSLTLHQLRHPRLLLKGDNVIANDVVFGESARVLVISGPNAGGKTITLTGVGLCALMVRSGLPIPVAPGSKIPFFAAAHSAIGDLQDLNLGLSTFSAHVTSLKSIVESAGTGALVLVDEIAADTDPREGAAIATAVLEALIEKGAMVLATTHLEALKALAHVDERFVNARVGFDTQRMAPTYKLQMGASGASSAVEVARRVGLSAAICDRASALANDAGGALSKAIRATEDERTKHLALQETLKEELRAASETRRTLDSELSAHTLKRQREELRFRDALRAELEFARQSLRTLVEKLETSNSEKRLAQAKQSAAEMTARINEQTVAARTLRKAIEDPSSTSRAPLELRVGARALLPSLDAEVDIVSIDDDAVTVLAGSLRMKVSVSDLEAPRAKPPAKLNASAGRKATAVPSSSAQPALALAAPSLDVRGERAEDAVRLIEQFFDRLTMSGDAVAVVLHGHGTGALKSTVRTFLKNSPYAKAFRPGESAEGGDGVTVVSL